MVFQGKAVIDGAAVDPVAGRLLGNNGLQFRPRRLVTVNHLMTCFFRFSDSLTNFLTSADH